MKFKVVIAGTEMPELPIEVHLGDVVLGSVIEIVPVEGGVMLIGSLDDSLDEVDQLGPMVEDGTHGLSFVDGQLSFVDGGQPMVLDPGPPAEAEDVTTTALAAAAAWTPGVERFPRALFDEPLDIQPGQVITYDETGRVYGYVGEKDRIALGMGGREVRTPYSLKDYRPFHQSVVNTDQGPLRVGRLVVGRLGKDHCDTGIGVAAAANYYTNQCDTWAYVRAGQNKHGVWVSGVLNPRAPHDMILEASKGPNSGHWEPMDGNPEMVGVVACAHPRLPIMNGEGAIAASFEPQSLEDRVATLVDERLTQVHNRDRVEKLVTSVNRERIDAMTKRSK